MNEYLEESRFQQSVTEQKSPEVTTQRTQVTEQNTLIEIRDLNKWYGQFHVLRDINLTVKKGEKIVICGPSGSGKSTLIRWETALVLLTI